MYKAFEYAGDTAELENIVKFDQITPILASAATGVLYKSTGTLIALGIYVVVCQEAHANCDLFCSWSQGDGARWRSRRWSHEHRAVRRQAFLPAALEIPLCLKIPATSSFDALKFPRPSAMD